MSPKTETTDRFKGRATEILAKNAPTSVESFLKDSIKPEKVAPPAKKPANPQTHNSTLQTPEPPARLGRLHIEVRVELVQQLMQRVYQRKCDPEHKGRSTQRAVIEEALDEYFRRHPF